jgi:flavodoxin I
MSKIGLFYASSTGNTTAIAESIKDQLAEFNIEIYNLDNCDANAMQEYKYLILGSSTWGEGDLQDDWDTYMPHLEKIDFSNKTVALFGLGDQEEYPDNFLNAMGTIYDKVTQRGANVIGSWSTEGYEFDDSTAIRNDEFVGLAIDEDNQAELSDTRIVSWISQIKPYLSI